MSQEALAKLVERASIDATFRAQLQSHPERALAGYELTSDERAALLRGDAGTPQGIGVDGRVTKMQGKLDGEQPGGMEPFAG